MAAGTPAFTTRSVQRVFLLLQDLAQCLQVVAQRIAHRDHAERAVELHHRHVAKAAPCMARSACTKGSSGCIVCGWAVMTSARSVVSASRSSASTRMTASRSVKMPVRRVPSTTSIAPTLCSRMARDASRTVAVLGAVTGFCPATMERSERIDIAFLPARLKGPIERPWASYRQASGGTSAGAATGPRIQRAAELRRGQRKPAPARQHPAPAARARWPPPAPDRQGMDLEAALSTILHEQDHRIVARQRHLVTRRIGVREEGWAQQDLRPAGDELHVLDLLDPRTVRDDEAVTVEHGGDPVQGWHRCTLRTRPRDACGQLPDEGGGARGAYLIRTRRHARRGTWSPLAPGAIGAPRTSLKSFTGTKSMTSGGSGTVPPPGSRISLVV